MNEFEYFVAASVRKRARRSVLFPRTQAPHLASDFKACSHVSVRQHLDSVVVEVTQLLMSDVRAARSINRPLQ